MDLLLHSLSNDICFFLCLADLHSIKSRLLVIQEGHQLTVIRISYLIILGIFLTCQKFIVIQKTTIFKKVSTAKLRYF